MPWQVHSYPLYCQGSPKHIFEEAEKEAVHHLWLGRCWGCWQRTELRCFCPPLVRIAWKDCGARLQSVETTAGKRDSSECVDRELLLLSLQSCPTLCDHIDGSPAGSSIPGILQARILEWVAISFSNAWKWKVKVKSLHRAWLFATPWTAAYQPPPSMGFSRQEYWSGLPLPSLGDREWGWLNIPQLTRAPV